LSYAPAGINEGGTKNDYIIRIFADCATLAAKRRGF